jgi:hypothetical protein
MATAQKIAADDELPALRLKKYNKTGRASQVVSTPSPAKLQL